jgi:hypothetical protein
MVDPITLIITALAAGASAGVIDALKDNAKDAARAAYAKLRGLAGKRVAARPDGSLALDRYEAAPADDADLVAAARALMDLLDQAGARAGKYNVTITGGQGVQVGDGNVQFNRF